MVGEGLQSHLGWHDTVRRLDRHGEAFGVVQEVLGLCAVPSGIEADEPLQAREERHGRVRDNVQKILELEEGRVPPRNARVWKVEGEEEESQGKSATGHGRNSKLGERGGVSWNIAKRGCQKTEERCQKGRRDLIRAFKAPHEEHFLSSWLCGDVEGKAEEREKVNKEAKEESCKSGKRELEGEKAKGGSFFVNALAVNFFRV